MKGYNKLHEWLDKRYGKTTQEFIRLYTGKSFSEIPASPLKKKVTILNAFIVRDILQKRS